MRGEVLSRRERMLPHCQVGNVVDGEAEFRQRRVEFIQTAGGERKEKEKVKKDEMRKG